MDHEQERHEARDARLSRLRQQETMTVAKLANLRKAMEQVNALDRFGMDHGIRDELRDVLWQRYDFWAISLGRIRYELEVAEKP